MFVGVTQIFESGSTKHPKIHSKLPNLTQLLMKPKKVKKKKKEMTRESLLTL